MTARRHGWLATLAVTAALSGPALSQPQGEASARHLAEGLEHFRAGDYPAAIESFRAGYQLEAWPGFLFAWGQAERKRGDCVAAVELYRRFLASEPGEVEAERTREVIVLCGADPAADPPPPDLPHDPAPDPTEDPAPPLQQLPPPPPSVSRWYRDPWGGVLVGAGATSLAVGAGFFVASVRSEDAAEAAGTLPDFADELDEARTRRLVSQVAFAAGGALVIGGVVRYILRGDRVSAEVTVDATGRPALQVRGTF